MQRNDRHTPLLPWTGNITLDELHRGCHLSRFPDESLWCPSRFDHHGRWHRLVRIDGKLVALQLDPSGTLHWQSSEPLEECQIRQQGARLFVPLPFPHAAAAHLPADLATSFSRMSPFVHLASASLGEALMKAILRQVISATQAKKLLHRFVLEYGPAVEGDETVSYGFPTVEEIAALSPERLIACGLGYKARVIPRVARDLLDTHLEEQIQGLPAEMAVEQLERLKGVGRWTARVTICDLMGNWSVYPFEDLAVRRWAARLWPGADWPREEKAFLHAWQAVNGPYTGVVTCYLLAHAHNVSHPVQRDLSVAR